LLNLGKKTEPEENNNFKPANSHHIQTAADSKRLVSLIHPQNAASRRVAEKVGMVLCKESLWHNKPTCIYAIERWKSPLRASTHLT